MMRNCVVHSKKVQNKLQMHAASARSGRRSQPMYTAAHRRHRCRTRPPVAADEHGSLSLLPMPHAPVVPTGRS